jgi:hypothetical protein
MNQLLTPIAFASPAPTQLSVACHHGNKVHEKQIDIIQLQITAHTQRRKSLHHIECSGMFHIVEQTSHLCQRMHWQELEHQTTTSQEKNHSLHSFCKQRIIHTIQLSAFNGHIPQDSEIGFRGSSVLHNKHTGLHQYPYTHTREDEENRGNTPPSHDLAMPESLEWNITGAFQRKNTELPEHAHMVPSK